MVRLTDDGAVVDGFLEPLPEYRYEDWAAPLRAEMRDRFVAAARRLGARADPPTAVRSLRRLVALEPYDEVAHRLLVTRLREDGRLGEAADAEDHLAAVLDELG